MDKLKFIIPILVILVFTGLLGCSPLVSSESQTTPSTGVEAQAMPSTTDSPRIEVPGWEALHSDINWLVPSEVEVTNYYSGARAEKAIRIHNGNTSPTTFNISYKIPDSPREGYSIPPTEAQGWVIIADNTPLLAARETKEILIALAIPGGTIINTKQWEFWISTKEKSTDLVQTELCERWLINMR